MSQHSKVRFSVPDLFESMAINLYLAVKHNRNGFLPTSVEDQALCHQWSFWGLTEIEQPLLTILIDRFMTPTSANSTSSPRCRSSLLSHLVC